MAGSGRSQNTDLHQCFLDIDLFDLPFKVRARSTLGPTAEIVSRLLPGSLTECRLITVGLLLSRTLKQTSQGQVFPIIPRRQLPSGRSRAQVRSLSNSRISGPPTRSLPLWLSKFGVLQWRVLLCSPQETGHSDKIRWVGQVQCNESTEIGSRSRLSSNQGSSFTMKE